MAEFEQFELSDGSLAVGLFLAIPPYGDLLIVGEDTSADSESVLQSLEINWADLWPEMLTRLKDAMENLDIDVDLAEQEIVGSASRTQPGNFMSDKADIYLSLSFADSPEWDYFIRGARIVHFQPVF